jgi:hypothetical protein
MVRVYLICKPYITSPLEPYLLAKSLYTVSKEKAEKLLKLFYVTLPEGMDETTTCITIAQAMQENSCEQFFTFISEAKNAA